MNGYIRCMRTTLDLEKPVLDGLKALQKRERRSLSQLASELLADALDARRKGQQPNPSKLSWNTAPMQARVDLRDKDAVNRILDEEAR